MRSTKVYFAGAETMAHSVLMSSVGVKYALYTSAHWLGGMLGNSRRGPSNGIKETYRFLQGNFKKTILDSGIFTIYGSPALQKDKLVYRWYDAYKKLIADNSIYSTVVEMDAQRFIGAKKTWELRKDFCETFKDREIINVFHYEDGIKGLDEMIEFSSYIAVPAPERRLYKSWNFNTILKVAEYIRNKKPDIKIHMLGCTSKDMLRCRIADTCDSTSWTTVPKFRTLFGQKVTLTKEKMAETRKKYESALKLYKAKTGGKSSLTYACYVLGGMEGALRFYQLHGGDQS